MNLIFESGSNKGSLTLFNDWIDILYPHLKNITKENFFKVFKEIRKERTKPAHEINDDYYDLEFENKQKEILKNVLFSLQNLRRILEIQAKIVGKDISSIERPSWLDDNKSIKFF